MMKISPEKNFENAYNIQQQMRNADINNQEYRKLFLETVDRDIQTIKLQLDNPNLAKDTSDHLFEELELKLKSRLEQTDPSFMQKTNAIQTEISTLKAQYERQEANTIIKDYKFMASISGDPMINRVFMDMPSITQSYNKLIDMGNRMENKRIEYQKKEREKKKEKYRQKTMTDLERKQQTAIENYIPNLFDEEGNIVVDPAVEPAVLPVGEPPAGALPAGEPPAGAPAEVGAEAPVEAEAPKKKKKKEKEGGGGASESKGDKGPIIISKKPTLKAGLDDLLQKVKNKYGPTSTKYYEGMTTTEMKKEIQILEAKKMIKSTGLEERDKRLRETKGKKKGK